MAGVHWGYEETKTYLAILSETQFYEALQNCHRNSQLYGAVAERLWEYGFLRTPEQCRTKFKSLHTSYRKVKNGQAPETCPFFEEMDALVSARGAALPSDVREEEAALCPTQETSEAEAEKQAEEADEAIEEDSEDDEEDTEVPPEAMTRAPVLFQSPSGKIDPRQQRWVGRGSGTGSAPEGLRRSDNGAPFPGMGLVAQTSLPVFRPNTSLPKPDPACILVLIEEETWVHRSCWE